MMREGVPRIPVPSLPCVLRTAQSMLVSTAPRVGVGMNWKKMESAPVSKAIHIDLFSNIETFL